MHRKEPAEGDLLCFCSVPRLAAPRGIGAWPQEIHCQIGRQVYQCMPSYQRTKQDGSNDDDDYIRELTVSPALG